MQDVFEKASRFEVKERPSSHAKSIMVIRFSPGGGLMAIADDGGYLVLRETQNWKRVRKLKASAPIRALEFHPVDQYALVVGCTNGEIVKMIVDPSGPSSDFYANESVDGFIHTIAIDDAGNHVAVAYANHSGIHVKVFTLDNFHRTWGNGRFLPTPVLDQASFSGYPFIRKVNFLAKDRILVSFFPDSLGLRIFNIGTIPFLLEKTIQLRPGTLIGGSAVSPSRRIVAVANMLDGIDIYNIARAQLIKTITFPMGELYMVDICFLNEGTLVCGHSRGELVIASCSIPRAGLTVEPVKVGGINTDPLQAIAVATIGDILWVAAGSTPIIDKASRVMLFRRDREEDFPDTAKGTLMQIFEHVPRVARYALAALVLSLGFAALSSPPKDTDTYIAPEKGLTDHGLEATATSPTHYALVDPTTKTTTVTTTMRAITKIATIPGPMTTATELVVEKVTETHIITATVGAGLPTPACAIKTLFEVSTQTVTTTVERVVETSTPPVCPRDGHQSLTLGGLFDHICGIAGMCLMVWSFNDLYPNPSREVHRVIATPDDEEVGAYGEEKGTKGSAEDENGNGNDVVDDERSVIETTDTESTPGQADISDTGRDGDAADDEDSVIGTAESESTPGTLDESDTEEEVKEYDTGFDTDDFAKGAEAAEQGIGENPPGQDDDQAIGDEKPEERIGEDNAREDEGLPKRQEGPTEQGGEKADPDVSEQQEPSERFDPAEDVVSDGESNIASTAAGNDIPDGEPGSQPGPSEEGEQVEPQSMSEETGATRDPQAGGTEAGGGPKTPGKKARSKKKGKRSK